MEAISNAIKCVNCREVLVSPVVLPCSDSICKKHVTYQSIICGECGIEHKVPENGFIDASALAEIIAAQIDQIDLGSLHKQAKKSCESFEELLTQFENLLKDPFHLTHERISGLKNKAQLKGEKLKIQIDEWTNTLLDKLDEYESQCKLFISSNEYQTDSNKLDIELKSAQSKLNDWNQILDT